MKLDLTEISDHKRFEDLVVSYFEDLKSEQGNNITDIKIKPSGVGIDGGRDILITANITDGITTYNKTWVIQCKFHVKNISTDELKDINIPTLIHSYHAVGYLLICREKATSKLTDLFERLEQNCIFQNKYIIWSGEQFKTKILNREKILEQYFPEYYSYITKLKGAK